MKRILVTGSAGFVGANFVEYLLEKTNHEIIGLDSLRHMGDSQRISKSERFYHYTHDLNTPISDVLATKIGDVDMIINIASESAIDRSIKNILFRLIWNGALYFEFTFWITSVLNLNVSAKSNEAENTKKSQLIIEFCHQLYFVTSIQHLIR